MFSLRVKCYLWLYQSNLGPDHASLLNINGHTDKQCRSRRDNLIRVCTVFYNKTIIKIEYQCNFDIPICDPLNYIMDHPILILSHWVSEFVSNVLPMAKVVSRQGHSLEYHPTEWRSRGSNSGPLDTSRVQFYRSRRVNLYTEVRLSF